MSDYVNITYTPLQDGDPIKTVWNDFEFIANRPVPIPTNASYPVTLTVEQTDRKTGVITRQPQELRMSMVERAKQNPYFQVEGFAQAQPPGPRKKLWDFPKTSAGYRSYALTWFFEENDPKAFQDRWEQEAPIREKCLWDEDDEKWISKHYETRLGMLMGARAVGIDELPSIPLKGRLDDK